MTSISYQIILFGSGARNDFTPGSDIDLAIDAPEMTDANFTVVWAELEELPIVFKLDTRQLQKLSNQKLPDTIKAQRIDFYHKK